MASVFVDQPIPLAHSLRLPCDLALSALPMSPPPYSVASRPKNQLQKLHLPFDGAPSGGSTGVASSGGLEGGSAKRVTLSVRRSICVQSRMFSARRRSRSARMAASSSNPPEASEGISYLEGWTLRPPTLRPDGLPAGLRMEALCAITGTVDGSNKYLNPVLVSSCTYGTSPAFTSLRSVDSLHSAARAASRRVRYSVGEVEGSEGMEAGVSLEDWRGMAGGRSSCMEAIPGVYSCRQSIVTFSEPGIKVHFALVGLAGGHWRLSGSRMAGS